MCIVSGLVKNKKVPAWFPLAERDVDMKARHLQVHVQPLLCLLCGVHAGLLWQFKVWPRFALILSTCIHWWAETPISRTEQYLLDSNILEYIMKHFHCFQCEVHTTLCQKSWAASEPQPVPAAGQYRQVAYFQAVELKTQPCKIHQPKKFVALKAAKSLESV